MDRIDLHIEVTPVPFDELHSRTASEASTTIRARVEAARTLQQQRFANETGVYCNAQMGARLVRKHAILDNTGTQLIKMAIQRLGLSARGYDRVLKVARTIADLAASPNILAEHVAEAIQYRSLDRSRWQG